MTYKRYTSEDTIPIPPEVLKRFAESSRPPASDEDVTADVCPRCAGEGRLTTVTQSDGGWHATSELSCVLCHGVGLVSPDQAVAWRQANTHADA